MLAVECGRCETLPPRRGEVGACSSVKESLDGHSEVPLSKHSVHRVHGQTEHLIILLMPLFGFTSCFSGSVGSSERAEISALFMLPCVQNCAKWKPIFRTPVTLHPDPWDPGEVLMGPPGGFLLIRRQPSPGLPSSTHLSLPYRTMPSAVPQRY